MERESELVKVTGGMSPCERGELQGMGCVENGCGAAPRSSSAFPGNIPVPWPCQHGGESWLGAPVLLYGCCWSISRSTGWSWGLQTA